MRLWLFAALVAAGCTKEKGDSLVVVTVDAMPALSNVALLHTISMAAGATTTHDVGAEAAPFSLGGGATKTFGVQLARSITGTFSICVEAHDSGGNVLGSGEGSTSIILGERADISITLGELNADMGGTDGSTDGGTDGGTIGVQPEPVWIGSGGSASVTSQGMNVSIGGFDTVGVSSASSGNTLGSPFSAQTE